MKYIWSVTVAVLLTVFSVQSASAQVSTTTNADVVHYVALGLADQVVITLINEAAAAKATRFDLSPSAVSDLAAHGVSPAVIAAMRQPPTLQGQSLADAAKKTEEERAKVRQEQSKTADNTTKTDKASATKVYTNKDVGAGSGVSTEPNTFTPTADNIFVCKARSIKALFNAVSAEHNGYFTEQFSAIKLRDNPDLAVAAKADAASCEKGAYIGAMEKALKAEADESERLQGVLKRGIR